MNNISNTPLTPLSIEVFREKISKDAEIVDSRNHTTFIQGFVPGSISINISGTFGDWAGNLLSFDKPIVLITEAGKEQETAEKLANAGFLKVEGYLDGGFETWRNNGERADLVVEVEADELAMDIPFDNNLVVIDVRNEAEFAEGHVKEALNLPLASLTDPAKFGDFEDNHNLYIHCGGGSRSATAASLFKRQGIHNIRIIHGGWESIKDQESIKTEKDIASLN